MNQDHPGQALCPGLLTPQYMLSVSIREDTCKLQPLPKAGTVSGAVSRCPGSSLPFSEQDSLQLCF